MRTRLGDSSRARARGGVLAGPPGAGATGAALLLGAGLLAAAAGCFERQPEVGGALAVSLEASVSDGPPPLSVTFRAILHGEWHPERYVWDFADGGEPVVTGGGAVTHELRLPGAYPVRVEAWRGDRAAVSPPVVVTVLEPAPLALSVTASPEAGPSPLTVVLSAHAEGGIPPYAFAWDLGDGQTSTLRSLQHTYAEPGSYAASATAVDSVAEDARAEVTIQVSGP